MDSYWRKISTESIGMCRPCHCGLWYMYCRSSYIWDPYDYNLQNVPDFLVAVKKDGKYYWQSRENKEMRKMESGAFIHFIAPSSGYVKFIKPAFKSAASLMSPTEAKFGYIEHLSIGLRSVNYWGDCNYYEWELLHARAQNPVFKWNDQTIDVYPIGIDDIGQHSTTCRPDFDFLFSPC